MVVGALAHGPYIPSSPSPVTSHSNFSFAVSLSGCRCVCVFACLSLSARPDSRRDSTHMRAITHVGARGRNDVEKARRDREGEAAIVAPFVYLYVLLDSGAGDLRGCDDDWEHYNIVVNTAT